MPKLLTDAEERYKEEYENCKKLTLTEPRIDPNDSTKTVDRLTDAMNIAQYYGKDSTFSNHTIMSSLKKEYGAQGEILTDPARKRAHMVLSDEIEKLKGGKKVNHSYKIPDLKQSLIKLGARPPMHLIEAKDLANNYTVLKGAKKPSDELIHEAAVCLRYELRKIEKERNELEKVGRKKQLPDAAYTLITSLSKEEDGLKKQIKTLKPRNLETLKSTLKLTLKGMAAPYLQFIKEITPEKKSTKQKEATEAGKSSKSSPKRLSRTDSFRGQL